MSHRYIVDASIGIKQFLTEANSEEATALFASDYVLLVPDLFYVECANILWKRIRQGLYTVPLALRNLAYLQQMGLPTTSTAELAVQATSIAAIFDITAYDAAYVALAEQEQAPLITADERLLAKLAMSPYSLARLRDVPV